MAVATAFEQTFARDLPELVVEWKGSKAPAPKVLALNEPLAQELGLDPELLTAEFLAGSEVPGYAMGYAGHQFGFYSPRLGDGRALLLGEVAGRDLHLKGSGRTPFARGAADGKAAVGPMLREYLVSEAMHALGIPTTRSLAVVATGEEVVRETMLPGAVLVRVAASHIRVGTFEYAARLDPELTRRLADHAMARHDPEAGSYREFFAGVVARQADLVAQWMLAGFIHGVMNTDNMAISGETIDYGPCAFMEAYDPGTVFSSIDQGGRYAYGNQPLVAQWNLARLAEALLGLLSAEEATEILQGFAPRFNDRWREGLRAKLGGVPDDLVDEVPALLHEHEQDWTSFFRALSAGTLPVRFTPLVERWRAAGPDTALMDRVNPVYVPRNHLVEEALAAATGGDLQPFGRLLDAVTRPFEARAGLERYAAPAPEDFGPGYRTFCGT